MKKQYKRRNNGSPVEFINSNNVKSFDKNKLKAVQLDLKTNGLKTVAIDVPNYQTEKEYSTGGKILSSLASLVPGVGSVLSPTIGLIDQQLDQTKMQNELKYEQGLPQAPNVNSRIYGNTMANGGNVTKNFKQYNTGSHASGNDLSINAQGTPSDNAAASIQNKETAYTDIKGQTYIHSDVLSNPETGNKFNIDAAKLNKKFNKADVSIEDKNALDFSMKRLSILNDKVRSIKESVEMAYGGKLKKYNGGPGDPAIPPSENVMWDAKLNDLYLDEELAMNPPKPQDLTALPMRTANQNKSLENLDLSGLSKPAVKPVANQRNTSPDTLNSDYDYNVPAAVLKGIGLAKSAADALTPAEVEKTILPDYRKSDQQMYATNIDYTQAKQDALAASNLAGNVNRSASGSFEQYQGRQANNYANYADALGRVSMREALDRNQQYVQRAGYEQGKAVDTANRETRNRENNQMNQANANLADQKFFSELTQVADTFNKYEYYQDMIKNKKEIANATINEGIALIGANYANFGFSDDFMEKIKSGTASMDEMVKFISTTEQVKSKTKTTQ